MTNEFNEAIEALRTKVLAKEVMYSKDEFIKLQYVYSEINRVLFNRKRELKRGCGGCIPSAVKIVGNYINQYPKEPKEGNAKVNRVNIIKEFTTKDKKTGGIKKVDIEELSLKELREIFPNIKSISKEGFLKQVK